MNSDPQEQRDYRFVIGLLTGTVVGAGLAIWFAPQALELRDRLTESARNLRKRASEQYQQASDDVGDAIDGLANKGQDVRDNLADAVARGAHEVERYATAAKSDRPRSAR